MASLWKRILRGDDPVVLTAAPPEQSARPATLARETRGGVAVLTAADFRARAAALRRTKYREGYDIAGVEALAERIAAALDARDVGRQSPFTAEDVLHAKFKATKFREGYDQDEVDDLLDLVVAALRA